jgi:hypothetical protein
MNHDVGRLDVAMHDMSRVSVSKAFRQFLQDVETPHQRQHRRSQLFTERCAFHELHHDVWMAVVLANVVDLDDVRVTQEAGGACLLHEPAPHLLVGGTVRVQEFNRDEPHNMRVARTKDDTHAALTETIQDFVSPDALRQLRHRAAFGLGETSRVNACSRGDIISPRSDADVFSSCAVGQETARVPRDSRAASRVR